jgi:hypothetical protein
MIVIYQTENVQTQIDGRLENETVWLNIGQMTAVFDKEGSTLRRPFYGENCDMSQLKMVVCKDHHFVSLICLFMNPFDGTA